MRALSAAGGASVADVAPPEPSRDVAPAAVPDPLPRPFWVRNPWVWRVVALGFLSFLVVAAVEEVRSGDPLALKVLVLSLMTAYGAVYLAVLPSEVASYRDARTVAVLGTLGVVLVALLGPDSIGLLMYALVSAATTLPPARAIPVVWVTCAGMLLYTGLVGDGPHWAEVSVYGGTALMLVILMSLRTAVFALREANDEVARLAVADERARLARDLHDVLGHSLTTITVKAALARRLMEAGETARATAEITDVEVLTRQTLADVRSTVSAQRRASLPAELAGSRAVLTAAGIEAVLPQATDEVAEPYREAFAHVLREAVTNVVRHSGARRCEVRLGPSWVEVRDDGSGAVVGSAPGTGIAGLRERLGPLGATVHAGPAPGGGFLLRVSADEPATAVPA
jgi:two-component system sensor histidine kinase DesK